MTRKKTKLPKSRTLQSLAASLQDYFALHPYQQLSKRQIINALSIRKEDQYTALELLLESFTYSDYLLLSPSGLYQLNTRQMTVDGILIHHNDDAYLKPTDGGDNIYIPQNKKHNALMGDSVRVLLSARAPHQTAQGEVIEILRRGRTTFVGTIDKVSSGAFVSIQSKEPIPDFYIAQQHLHGAKHAQKVIIHLLDTPPTGRHLEAEVIEILGNNTDNNTEMHAILAEYGFPTSYPKEAEQEAMNIQDSISPEELSQRRDLRHVNTFTIDPVNAKDFDDALSVRKLDDETLEIGVHIADVTHYVTPHSLIDQEAQHRATSVYLVDRTIPMLPERLCNQLCSLRPNEDKRCFSVVFHINMQAKVLKYDICKTLIRSNHRFTYEDAQAVLDANSGPYAYELNLLNKIAQQLREERFRQGAINFERTEVSFLLDDEGHPIDIINNESSQTHQLIEEFMLLANKTVATHIARPGRGRRSKTFVYRVHDVPNPDKLQSLASFINKFGYKLKTAGSKSQLSTSINNLLGSVNGQAEANLIETLTIRSMAKAVYTTQNIGHYGLAFDYYTHFTSPIRRYPDMLVHRLLALYLQDGNSVNEQEYEALCQHCSSKEQLAASAERASIKYKQVEYMSQFLNECFEGVITGVQEWGLYVELLSNKCEGMIHIRDLSRDDYFTLDENNFCITGRRSGRKYRIGDKIKIRVSRTDLNRKQLDFVLA